MQAQNAAQLKAFWDEQMEDIKKVPIDPSVFKNHQLPLARIKKIMKSDEDVRMISAEAPVLFAKACELFILELTLRAWMNSEESKRRTLQRNDIAAAITKTDVFDFLLDIVPREEAKDDNAPRPPQGAHQMYAQMPYAAHYLAGQTAAAPGAEGYPSMNQMQNAIPYGGWPQQPVQYPVMRQEQKK